MKFASPAFALSVCLAFVAVSGCESNQAATNSIAGMQRHFSLPAPTPAAFDVCREHGCRERSRVSLSAAQWDRVRQVMTPPAADAVEERRRVAQATALLETMVAGQAGTGGDVGGTFSGLGHGKGQLDCEDEAANTTQYLVMLRDDGLLRWHVPTGRQWRGSFLNGWPHTTAMMAETGTGTVWAVDTWFEDNGRPAHVVEAARWKAGWSPDGKVGGQFGAGR